MRCLGRGSTGIGVNLARLQKAKASVPRPTDLLAFAQQWC